MKGQHHYKTTVQWTGNKGVGTTHYKTYERSHTIAIDHKPNILASSDPAFRGDKTKYNPEELFIASLSSCHMLWYLHLCSEAKIIITSYLDHATGSMTISSNGSGRFTEIILNPIVTVTESSMIEKANELHHKANELCFIANSINVKVIHHPACLIN